MLKILENGEKVIFWIKDNNSAYITNGKVSKGSECVKVSLTVSEN